MRDTLTTTLRADLQQLLKRQYPWITTSKIQEISKLFNAYPAGLRDRSSAVHLSASAFVPVGNTVLFIRHPYLKTVLLPAGHVEPNELPLQTAIREFHEETGYQVNPQSQQLIDANVIEIPANPLRNEGAHRHIDLRFLFRRKLQAPLDAELPVFQLSEKDAPSEFQSYYQLIPMS